ncbi:MAG: peptidyl-prolyl cis-trans isomerase [Sulfurospirillum cavolei]|uniref:peptidylprolyl isomerase n=1 Tax=Sulfurospirillum cavolei TaxID=366522 RepID=UPI000764A421|nr:peptidylprolyl isomerase [Sulfurospirillum cavolei]MCD8543334.1 peptidyl-prolyl cis-trans isomerase [Sulfurospirillum cavolei]MDY0265978.1 peptidyl-prolyl cis-trans isomerase [Sulfurospirillum cavolei]
MKLKRTMLTLVTLGVTLFLTPSIVTAATLDGVSVIINKEPITLFDVFKYSQRFQISKKEALDILVRQKLEDSEIKKQGISVDGFEVDQHIDKLAINNQMSTYDFLNMLRSKNIDTLEYKEEIKKKLQRDKLYQKIVRDKMKQLSDGELLAYYNENQNEFSQAASFDVSIYSSANQQSLTTIQNNPMSAMSDVELKDTTFEATKMDQNLAGLLNKTPVGKFSSVVKTDQGYVMFFVKNKHDVKAISFDNAKNYIYGKLADGKEKQSIDDYFEKLKSSANIQVVRAP